MTIHYGGDYNPEQWPKHVWDADAGLFDQAAVTTVSIGIFAWSLLQPGPDSYDFTVLDEILDHLDAHGTRYLIATGTAAVPPWLATAHPDVCRTDFEGRVHRYGQRHNACPSSPAYRELSARLAGRLAERYRDRPGLVAWHVNNEYGGQCYCGLCEQGFRTWLKQRYGTLAALNHAWWTRFWGHVYTDWDQIQAPSMLTEHWKGPRYTAFNATTLDYKRFQTDAICGNFVDEKQAIRRHSDAPCTTNLMGAYEPLDYFTFAPHLDFVSWDSYPQYDDDRAMNALMHDLMRGLKGGQPFWLMEQTPSSTSSRDTSPMRRPGELSFYSYQAVAHGADAVMYFQMRASRGACEKWHGAVIWHGGRGDTRHFREVAELGHELSGLGELAGARTPARVALVFDWHAWWAQQLSDGPNRHVDYKAVMASWHAAFRRRGIDVDVVASDSSFDGYDVVAAPLLYLVRDGVAEALTAAAHRGASVWTGFLSGRVDSSDLAFLDVWPGPLKDLCGIRIDETDGRVPDWSNGVVVDGRTYDARLVFDIVATEGAEVVGTYAADWYAGLPALTRHQVGAGEGWYLATVGDDDLLDLVVDRLASRHGLGSPLAVAGVEVSTRRRDDVTWRFVACWDEPREITVDRACRELRRGVDLAAGDILRLAPYQVAVLRHEG